MPRNSIQMTQARVKALNPPEVGQSLIYDQEIPNLAVRLSPGGAKTFIVYKKIDGKPRRISIGRFPGLTVEEARRQAKKIIGKIADGIDPVKERQKDEALALTLEKALEEYKKARESKLRPKTLSEYQRMVDSYLPDWLGKAT
ncbi:MAG: Arm DNA-binding domain-containing protein, partial [bacterium]